MKKLLPGFGPVALVSVRPFYIHCKQWRDALWGKGTWGHSPFPTCQCRNWMAGRGALLEPWWGKAKGQLEVRRQNEKKKMNTAEEMWDQYLYGTGCTTMPGQTSESWKAMPKSINLTFRSSLLASIMLSGLTSACKILTRLRASKAVNTYRKEDNFKFPSQQK